MRCLLLGLLVVDGVLALAGSAMETDTVLSKGRKFRVRLEADLSLPNSFLPRAAKGPLLGLRVGGKSAGAAAG